MKKLFALALAALVLLSFAACTDNSSGNEESGEENVQIVNPIEEVDSAAAFGALGLTLDAPSGAKDVRYSIISGKIAQVNFTVDGHEYTLRASNKETDFSGLYGDVTGTRYVGAGAVLVEQAHELVDVEEPRGLFARECAFHLVVVAVLAQPAGNGHGEAELLLLRPIARDGALGRLPQRHLRLMLGHLLGSGDAGRQLEYDAVEEGHT